MSCWMLGVTLQVPRRRVTRARWNGGGATLPDPFVLCRSPSGAAWWRAPVCHRGCHLPNRRKTNSKTEAREWRNIEAPSGGSGRDKKHECKYFRRSVPLHHCWLCLILWASTNNGRWDFFFFLSQQNPENVICVTAVPHQDAHTLPFSRRIRFVCFCFNVAVFISCLRHAPVSVFCLLIIHNNTKLTFNGGDEGTWERARRGQKDTEK